MRFKCNGGTPTEGKERYIEPSTPGGVAMVEASVTVTREQVEEYFGHDGYSCFCTAWNARSAKIMSNSASVAVACEYKAVHFLMLNIKFVWNNLKSQIYLDASYFLHQISHVSRHCQIYTLITSDE